MTRKIFGGEIVEGNEGNEWSGGNEWRIRTNAELKFIYGKVEINQIGKVKKAYVS